MLPTFKNGHFVGVCTEKITDHQYGKTAPEI